MSFGETFATLSKLYALLEEHFRRAATNKKPTTIRELLTQGDLAAAMSKPQQLRDAVTTLHRRGHLILTKRGAENEYLWDVDSPPFTLGVQHKAKAAELAGKPMEVVQVNAAKPKAISINPAKDIELVFNGTLIVIGRNTATGRVRLILEDIGV